MPFDPVKALASAATLKSSPGLSNFDSYAGMFNPGTKVLPDGTHVGLSASEEGDLSHVQDEAATALGASPAIVALRQQAGERRMQHGMDVAAEDEDLATHGMQRLQMQNQFADYNSERGANRQFLGNAAALHARDYGDKMHQIREQFIRPAEIEADSRLATEDLRGGYAVDAARTRAAGSDRTQEIALKGLLDAAIAQIKTKGRLDPAMLHQLEQFAPGAAIQP